jgi:hypothetical protein
MTETKEEPKVELTREQLILLQNLLYANRWTIEESEKVVKPLINLLAKMTDKVDGK